jgi:hypothetical protein
VVRPVPRLLGSSKSGALAPWDGNPSANAGGVVVRDIKAIDEVIKDALARNDLRVVSNESKESFLTWWLADLDGDNPHALHTMMIKKKLIDLFLSRVMFEFSNAVPTVNAYTK